MTEVFKNDEKLKQRFRDVITKKALSLGEHIDLERQARACSVPVAIAGLIAAVTTSMHNPGERQLQLVDAMHIGADLSLVPRQFAIWLLSNPQHDLLRKVQNTEGSLLHDMIRALQDSVKPCNISDAGKVRLATAWMKYNDEALAVAEKYKDKNSDLYNAWLSAKHVAEAGRCLMTGETGEENHWATMMKSVSESINRAYDAHYYVEKAEFMKRPWPQRVDSEPEFRERMGRAKAAGREDATRHLRGLLSACKSPVQALLEDTPSPSAEPEAEDVRLKRVLGQLSQASSLIKFSTERTKLVEQALVTANGFVAITDRSGASSSLQLALEQLQLTETAFGKTDDRASFISQSEATSAAFEQLEEFSGAAKALKLALLGIYASSKGRVEAATHDRVTNRLRAVGATLKQQRNSAELPTHTESAHTVEGSE